MSDPHAICKQATRVHVAQHKRDAAEIAVLRVALEEALDFAEEGWSYASPYFQERWQYRERLAELRALLAQGAEEKEKG